MARARGAFVVPTRQPGAATPRSNDADSGTPPDVVWLSWLVVALIVFALLYAAVYVAALLVRVAAEVIRTQRAKREGAPGAAPYPSSEREKQSVRR